MNIKQILASATVAAVLGTAGISIAGATSDGGSSSTSTSTPSTPKDAAAPKTALRDRLVRQALKLAAQTIGIDAKALVQELRAGKSVADVATEHGVQPQTVIDALVQAATTKINAAHDAGKLTDAQTTKLLAKLPDFVARLVNHQFGAHAAAA
ncbi:MAG TPA: hypothetical protein VFR41_06720 [Acidimicrobiia bacterium]|nr:hypothetical protein [Acidimicrobiia bacterium]